MDTVDNDLRAFAIQLIQLECSLREYGSETLPARALLRSYTAAKIAATWIDEPAHLGTIIPSILRAAPWIYPTPACLALTKEEIIEPGLEIVDPHHHLWDHPGNRFLLDQLLADGRCVRRTHLQGSFP